MPELSAPERGHAERSDWLRALRARRWLRDCDRVGRGAQLDGKPYVENLGFIAIGDDLMLKSLPVLSHLVTGRGGRLQIGNGVRIAHGAAIAAHHDVEIGDDVQMAPFAMVMDTDFHEAGNHDSAGGTAPIRIGAGVRLGSRVTVLRGSVIGAGAFVEAGSVVGGEIPPGAHVAGVPARPKHFSAYGDTRDPDSGASLDRVRRVVARTLGLMTVPDGNATRDEIAAWDSLGALNIMLSLEDAFGVALGSDDMASANCVADLLRAVSMAKARQGGDGIPSPP